MVSHKTICLWVISLARCSFSCFLNCIIPKQISQIYCFAIKIFCVYSRIVQVRLYLNISLISWKKVIYPNMVLFLNVKTCLYYYYFKHLNILKLRRLWIMKSKKFLLIKTHWNIKILRIFKKNHEMFEILSVHSGS